MMLLAAMLTEKMSKVAIHGSAEAAERVARFQEWARGSMEMAGDEEKAHAVLQATVSEKWTAIGHMRPTLNSDPHAQSQRLHPTPFHPTHAPHAYTPRRHRHAYGREEVPVAAPLRIAHQSLVAWWLEELNRHPRARSRDRPVASADFAGGLPLLAPRYPPREETQAWGS
tara:strand:+ start:380 stop:889 length:510 start_codon:yes stop_codon:yes gene_type:complete